MLRLLKKIIVYGFSFLICLEILVRLFHLHNHKPERFADSYNVEKWLPNQEGYSVTGNRRQNVGKYRINNFGFNSVYNDFKISEDQINIALVGDSFIEGFHEDYTNSLGQQIEQHLDTVKVLEFGYAGYDLADELNLIKSYDFIFEKLDHVFVYLRYTDDLKRNEYELSSRLALNTSTNKILKNSKLIVYLKEIGVIDAILNKVKNEGNKPKKDKTSDKKKNDKVYLRNFKKLVEDYHYDKEKYILLLDTRLCSDEFLYYIKANKFKYIDIGKALAATQGASTLIYDQHWSKEGRGVMAKSISEYVKANIIN